LDHVDTGIDNRLANFGAELDHILVHLRLDLLFKDNLPILEDLLDVRPQLTRLRIDNREFLFNAESKRVVLGAHQGNKSPSKTRRCRGGPPAARPIHLRVHVISYANTLSARRITAAWTYLPQLKLSRPGWC